MDLNTIFSEKAEHIYYKLEKLHEVYLSSQTDFEKRILIRVMAKTKKELDETDDIYYRDKADEFLVGKNNRNIAIINDTRKKNIYNTIFSIIVVIGLILSIFEVNNKIESNKNKICESIKQEVIVKLDDRLYYLRKYRFEKLHISDISYEITKIYLERSEADIKVNINVTYDEEMYGDSYYTPGNDLIHSDLKNSAEKFNFTTTSGYYINLYETSTVNGKSTESGSSSSESFGLSDYDTKYKDKLSNLLIILYFLVIFIPIVSIRRIKGNCKKRLNAKQAIQCKTILIVPKKNMVAVVFVCLVIVVVIGAYIYCM